MHSASTGGHFFVRNIFAAYLAEMLKYVLTKSITGTNDLLMLDRFGTGQKVYTLKL